MRKLIVSNLVTVDGYFAGTNGEIDWHNVDNDFNQYAAALLDEVDTLIFGRVTYQLMASYWPKKDAITNDPIIAPRMNRLQKIVFSKTLHKVDWKNSRLAKNDPVQEIINLKQQPGKDMVIFGSGSIVSALTPMGLIDDFRLIVNPLILGEGKSMFSNIADRTYLELMRIQSFKNGNVLLQYKRASKN